MKLQVSSRMTIAELQQAFTEYFPYLSLSFFTKSRTVYQSAPVKYCITNYNIPLERMEPQPHNADVDIPADMTVSDLEQLFEREFGLHVQVLHRGGNFGQDAPCLDGLSLRVQNTRTEHISCEDAHLAQPVEYYDARSEWYLG